MTMNKDLENPGWLWWLYAEGLKIIGHLSERCDPRELSEVVLLFNPVQRLISEFFFFITPVVCVGIAIGFVDLYCLYQSGILSFCNDAWTRNWCSLSVLLLSCNFCNSFSGGYKKRKHENKIIIKSNFCIQKLMLT